jgi:hypothetical protein
MQLAAETWYRPVGAGMVSTVRLSRAQASTWKEAKEQMKELQAEEEEIKQRELKLKQEK